MRWFFVLVRDSLAILGLSLVAWVLGSSLGILPSTGSVSIGLVLISCMGLAWLKAELVDWPKERSRSLTKGDG